EIADRSAERAEGPEQDQRHGGPGPPIGDALDDEETEALARQERDVQRLAEHRDELSGELPDEHAAGGEKGLGEEDRNPERTRREEDDDPGREDEERDADELVLRLDDRGRVAELR